MILGIPAQFLIPSLDKPKENGAALVAAGASAGYDEHVAQLIKEGVRENLVVSNSYGSEDEVGYADCYGIPSLKVLTETWGMESDNLTTTGEATGINKLAKQGGWISVIAVTNRSHKYQACTNLERCTDLAYLVVSIDGSDVIWGPFTWPARLVGAFSFGVRTRFKPGKQYQMISLTSNWGS